MRNTLIAVTASALMSAGTIALADEPTQAAVTLTDSQMDLIVAGGAPERPGAFGRDRSANTNGDPAGLGLTGKQWGAIAASRAGDNGNQNQAYKVANGGAPSKGKP